jgi:hypothetical protein
VESWFKESSHVAVAYRLGLAEAAACREDAHQGLGSHSVGWVRNPSLFAHQMQAKLDNPSLSNTVLN